MAAETFKGQGVKTMSATASPAKPAGGAALAGMVLGMLIAVAAVASLPLTMANVALPSIGASFDASHTQRNLMAILGVTLAAGYAAAMAGKGMPLPAAKETH
jgi:hypothetical protein